MLEQMSQRLHASRTFEDAVRRILIDVVALHGAEFGNIQMLTGGGLAIVDQQGLDTDFLRAFRKVRSEDGCACARALKEGRPVIVIDIERRIRLMLHSEPKPDKRGTDRSKARPS